MTGASFISNCMLIVFLSVLFALNLYKTNPILAEKAVILLVRNFLLAMAFLLSASNGVSSSKRPSAVIIATNTVA